MKTIAILMAVYQPRPEWLREQLLSLNRQTYGALRLYVRDDASPDFCLLELERLVGECVTAFPAVCLRNDRNMGSNQTFGLLSAEAQGDCFAYCDQDDIWEENKLERLAQVMEAQSAQLVCCDLSVIDEAGKRVANSVTEIKPHIVYRSGENLAPVFLSSNFVTGCAALVRADAARAALPFVRWTVHDQWLALVAASRGRLVSVPEALVRYRIHASNQTHTLGGVRTRQDYYEAKIRPFERCVNEFRDRIDLGAPQRQAEAWAEARCALLRRENGAWRRLLGLRAVNPAITCFELALPWMPEWVFRAALRAIQRGKL